MKHDVSYRGVRGASGCLVTCEGVAIRPRTDLRNHSSSGFDWGTGNSGSAQLALALLCDFYRDDKRALEYYEEFKTDMIAPIGGTSWTIKSDTLIEWTRNKMKERKNEAGRSPI